MRDKVAKSDTTPSRREELIAAVANVGVPEAVRRIKSVVLAIEQEPTEEMIDAGVNAYVKWYGEHDCWKCPDAIVFSEGVAAAYRAMEAARAKAT